MIRLSQAIITTSTLIHVVVFCRISASQTKTVKRIIGQENRREVATPVARRTDVAGEVAEKSETTRMMMIVMMVALGRVVAGQRV